MRVVVDYGLPRPAPPPQLRLPGQDSAAVALRTPGAGDAAGAAYNSHGERTIAAPATRRNEPVVIIHKGASAPEGLHQPQVAGGIAGGAGAGTSPGNDTRDATHANADGIPVPGTNYQLVTSEDALATSASVRAHERGHQMALGPYAASGINYTTRRGPDGQTIVTGGSIKADLSPVPGDPRATLRKASAVRGAALTPGDPSAADMRVAADAYRLAAQAKEELREERLNVQA